MMTPERPKVWVITRSSVCSCRNQPRSFPAPGLTTKSEVPATSLAVALIAW